MNPILVVPLLLAVASCAGQVATTSHVVAESGTAAAPQPQPQPAGEERAATNARTTAERITDAGGAARSWRLEAAAWARPRSGSALVGMAPLPQVVRAWSASGDSDVVILHAGGEQGELWARELRDWLIALGVPGDRVRRVVGGPGPNTLQLELRTPEGAR